MTYGEPDAVKAARPVRGRGGGKARATSSDTTPAVDAYWEDGGATELDNLVLLRLSHESTVRAVCSRVFLPESCCCMR